MTNTIKNIIVNVHVGGADVEIPGGIYVKCTIDISDCTFDDLANAMHHASSPRVKVQARLRALPTETLIKMGKTGYEIKLAELYGRNVQRTVVEVKSVSGALEMFPNVDDFIDACKSAGWLELTTEENLIRIHNNKYPE